MSTSRSQVSSRVARSFSTKDTLEAYARENEKHASFTGSQEKIRLALNRK